MKIDLAKYKANIPTVRRISKKHFDKPQSEIAQLVTEGTGMPLLASAYFVAGVQGKTNPDLTAMIDRIMAFYAYKEVKLLDREEYGEE